MFGLNNVSSMTMSPLPAPTHPANWFCCGGLCQVLGGLFYMSWSSAEVTADARRIWADAALQAVGVVLATMHTHLASPIIQHYALRTLDAWANCLIAKAAAATPATAATKSTGGKPHTAIRPRDETPEASSASVGAAAATAAAAVSVSVAASEAVPTVGAAPRVAAATSAPVVLPPFLAAHAAALTVEAVRDDAGRFGIVEAVMAAGRAHPACERVQCSMGTVLRWLLAVPPAALMHGTTASVAAAPRPASTAPSVAPLHAANLARAEACGAVDVLTVALLNHYSECAEVLVKCMPVLIRLVAGTNGAARTRQREAVAAGALDAALSVLHTHSTLNPDVALNAVELIRHLCTAGETELAPLAAAAAAAAAGGEPFVTPLHAAATEGVIDAMSVAAQNVTLALAGSHVLLELTAGDAMEALPLLTAPNGLAVLIAQVLAPLASSPAAATPTPVRLAATPIPSPAAATSRAGPEQMTVHCRAIELLRRVTAMVGRFGHEAAVVPHRANLVASGLTEAAIASVYRALAPTPSTLASPAMLATPAIPSIPVAPVTAVASSVKEAFAALQVVHWLLPLAPSIGARVMNQNGRDAIDGALRKWPENDELQVLGRQLLQALPFPNK